MTSSVSGPGPTTPGDARGHRGTARGTRARGKHAKNRKRRNVGGQERRAAGLPALAELILP
eukprot:2058608-Lingulodinium_polyedra.AAC.1